MASGSSVDWAFDTLEIFYSFAVELRDTGKHGFLLPTDQIIECGRETFEGVKALAYFIKDNLNSTEIEDKTSNESKRFEINFFSILFLSFLAFI